MDPAENGSFRVADRRRPGADRQYAPERSGLPAHRDCDLFYQRAPDERKATGRADAASPDRIPFFNLPDRDYAEPLGIAAANADRDVSFQRRPPEPQRAGEPFFRKADRRVAVPKVRRRMDRADDADRVPDFIRCGADPLFFRNVPPAEDVRTAPVAAKRPARADDRRRPAFIYRAAPCHDL